MMIKLIQENMPKSSQQLLLDVVERNSYFAHSENVLLSMLVDEDFDTRSKALNLIKQLRSATQQQNIRKFVRPKLNLNAKKYFEMVEKLFN